MANAREKASCQLLCAAALATAERHSELYDSIIHDVMMSMPLLHGDRFYSPEFLLVARHQKAQSSFSC